MKMLGRLQAGLARTRAGLAGRLGKLLRPGETRRLEDLLDQLEETLIEADVGPATAAELIAQIRNSPARDRRVTDVADLGRTLAGAIASLEGVDTAATDQASAPAKPRVVFLVGVNGGGKTTTAAKMAALYSGRGQKGLLVAADTFRAGAIDQLRVWSERIGVDLICHRDGADPSAVLFDGLKAAVARRSDFVVVDTAGRLHTKTPLMKELEKIYRIAAREVPGAPHESYLVIDATTGQNGVAQAREFLKAGRLTGIVLTKLDGTARGGVAIGISHSLGLPLRYVGVGESVDDLLEFSLQEYLDGLLAPQKGLDERLRERA